MEETQKVVVENKNTINNSERTSYWEELLGDRYEVQKVEEFNALGKGKRSRKQMVSVEDDDLAGLEDVSSDGEDDNFEAELTDGDTTSSGTQSGRRPYRKRNRVNTTEQIPLMEGEGKSFRVLGFNQSQRAAFVQILMRFGVGDFDWKEFASRLKQKSYEEIKDYGVLFLTHIAEGVTDSPTFSDGVPKEGLRIPDVLVRISVLMGISQKVKTASQQPGAPLFTNDIIMRYPALKGGKFWKEEHDLLLLSAVLKHGYGRWQAIVDDKDLGIQELICQELNLPFINLPVPGQAGSGNGVGGEIGQGVADAVNPAQLYSDPSILHHFRDMQRKQVEYVKKRVFLLEKGLNAECQKEYYGAPNTNEGTSEEPEIGEKVADMPSASSKEMSSKVVEHLPSIEVIASAEISAAACDDDTDRLALAEQYNKMCKIMEDDPDENQSGLDLKKNLLSLEQICGDICQTLSPLQPEVGTPAASESTAVRSTSPPNQQPAVVTEVEMENAPNDSEAVKPATAEEAGNEDGKGKTDGTGSGTESRNTGKSEASAGVIVLDE